MGKPTGFLEFPRQAGPELPPRQRLQNFSEFHLPLSAAGQARQAARCMDCGVPFCQAGQTMAGLTTGCPLHNLIPETNDLVYRGAMRGAWQRLQSTNCLPEFTGRVCPALCEAACTCAKDGEAVCIKENERAIAEYAFANGLVDDAPLPVRTGKTVAVVGSGPAGLAAAWLLNRRGHLVTVYEKSDRPGGLLRYGIPNMKLDKAVLDRRIAAMERAGVQFCCNTDIARGQSAEELLKTHDRVLLACGAGRPRDLAVPGREAKGIWFAVDFLGAVTKALLDSDFQNPPQELAKGRRVLVVGGGDTGNDCVGTVLRLRAKSVTQLEMMPARPPRARPPTLGRNGRGWARPTMVNKRRSSSLARIRAPTRPPYLVLKWIKKAASAPPWCSVWPRAETKLSAAQSWKQYRAAWRQSRPTLCLSPPGLPAVRNICPPPWAYR